MGCEWNFETLMAKNKEDALVEAQGLIDQAAWEHGHGGYSGSWAECPGAVFIKFDGDPDELEDWLDSRAPKWEPMVITEVAGVWYAGANCSS